MSISRSRSAGAAREGHGCRKAEACEANLNGHASGQHPLRPQRCHHQRRHRRHDAGGAVATTASATGTATVNEFDDAALEKAVRRSEELARLAPENPEFMPLLGPQHVRRGPPGSCDATAAITPEFRAQVAADSIAARRGSRAASPPAILEDSAELRTRWLNSNGLFGYHRAPTSTSRMTVRTEDGTGSG